MRTEEDELRATGTKPGGEVAGRPGRRPPARRDNARVIAAAVLGGITALFAVLNLDEVEVNWILGTWDTPLIVVIALSLATGFAFGVYFSRRRASAKR